MPLAGSLNSGLVLVVKAEGCSPDHFRHLWFAFLRRPRLGFSVAFSVVRCYLYLVPLHHYWDRGIVCLSHHTLLLQ